MNVSVSPEKAISAYILNCGTLKRALLLRFVLKHVIWAFIHYSSQAVVGELVLFVHSIGVHLRY